MNSKKPSDIKHTSDDDKDYRLEKDTTGVMKVPNNKYYGSQTARTLKNFNISDDRFPREVIRALGIVKKACALANEDLQVLESEKVDLIIKASDEVIEGKLDEHFPTVIWQTGSGTQTNMNANEVIANRAIEMAGGKMGSKDPIHPNDDVNRSQSSNCFFPTVMHVATAEAIHKDLLPSLTMLYETLQAKAILFKDIVKIGRTHLMDAVPLTLGNEFSVYAKQIRLSKQRITHALTSLYALSIGGTAVGTGLNAPASFSDKATQLIAEFTDLPFESAFNKFELLATHDALVYTSGTLKTLAASLTKIANDIRWMASGPRCGLSELSIPANEPGSSIMPGKVNPTQCEALLMICAQVMGLDVAIGIGGSLGNFELNVYKPLILFNVLKQIKILSDGMKSFNNNCVLGIKANQKNINQFLERSLMLVTALNPIIGYDKAATIAKKAFEENLTLKEAALASKLIDEKTFDEHINPKKMLGHQDA